MADLTFSQQLWLMLIDKLAIGGLLVFAAFGFNRILEAFIADFSSVRPLVG
jgi:hypothetical protein